MKKFYRDFSFLHHHYTISWVNCFNYYKQVILFVLDRVQFLYERKMWREIHLATDFVKSIDLECNYLHTQGLG